MTAKKRVPLLHVRLRRVRVTNGHTQKTMARKMGVSRSSVSGYETGRSEPSLQTVRQTARAFGVSIGYLLGNRT